MSGSEDDRRFEPQARAARRARLRLHLTFAAVLLSGGLALPLTGAQPARLLDPEGLRNAGEILAGLMRPDVSAEFLARVLERSVESLLIGVLGTVLPLAVLALMFLLAPLPMTPAAADVLRNASRLAGAIVLVHWAITLAVWAASKAMRPAAALQPQWQGIKLVRNANA